MNQAPTASEIRIGIALAAVLLFLPVVLTASSSLLWKVDFAVPYTGGLIERQGNAAKLYDLSEQQQVQEELLKRPGLLFDPYPPFHALLFAPLTRLGYRWAYVTWAAINILLWLLFYQLVRNEVGVSMRPFRLLKLSSLFFPLWIALFQGQFSVLLLVSFTLAFLYLKRGRDYVAGFALGFGLLKFQIVLPFALIFLLRRKWRFVAGLAAAAGLLGLVSLIAVGPSGVLSYVNLLLDIFRHPSNPAYATIRPWNMPTIRGLTIGVLMGAFSQKRLTLLAAILSGALVWFTAWYWEREESGGNEACFDLMFAASLVVSLVATPYLQPHDLLPVALAVILVIASPRWAVNSGERLVLIATVVILYASPLYLAALVARGALYLLTPVLITFVLGVLALVRHRTSLKPTSEQAEQSRPPLVATP